MTEEIDEVVCAAVRRAASEVAPAEGDRSFLEKRLAAAVGAALEDEFPAMTVSLNRRIGAEIPHWDPQPGSFDVVVLDPGQRPLVVAELKLDDVDQTLWDVLRVANALDIDGARAAYVIVAAPARTWESRLAYVELFDEPGEQEWYSRFLLETHASAWERLLRGGRGRPTRVPRVLFITPLLRAPVAFYPPYELRLVRVGKVDDSLPLVDGRPAGGDGEILDADLTAADLPVEDSGELAVYEFALTTNGYERMGSNLRCGALANAALESWRRGGTLPDNLRDLRCCLFFEQRRWHHFGDSFDEETLRYTRTLIREMRGRIAS